MNFLKQNLVPEQNWISTGIEVTEIKNRIDGSFMCFSSGHTVPSSRQLWKYWATHEFSAWYYRVAKKRSSCHDALHNRAQLSSQARMLRGVRCLLAKFFSARTHLARRTHFSIIEWVAREVAWTYSIQAWMWLEFGSNPKQMQYVI